MGAPVGGDFLTSVKKLVEDVRKLRAELEAVALPPGEDAARAPSQNGNVPVEKDVGPTYPRLSYRAIP